MRKTCAVVGAGAGSGAAAYSAQLEVAAAYLQVDAEFIPLVRTTFGVRYEDGYQSVTTRDLFGGAAPFAPTEIEEQYFLPSFTATWNFAEDQQFRVGASQTIGRPQFRELAPQSYTDPETDREFTGNPFLVDTEILNLDARYEWFFARQQYLTAGVFYKDLDRPVEATIVTSGNARQQSYLNSPQATVYGAEIEAKKFFEFPDNSWSFIADKRWLVQANYTWSDSEVSVGEGDTVITLGGGGRPEQASFFIQDGSQNPYRPNSLRLRTDLFVSDDNVKLIYFTPRFSGFQFGISYMPEPTKNFTGFAARKDNDSNQQADIWEFGASFKDSIGVVDVNASLVYLTGTNEAPSAANRDDLEEWGFGASFFYEGFTVGGSYRFSNARGGSSLTTVLTAGSDTEIWSIGATYKSGDWTFGLQYVDGVTELDTLGNEQDGQGFEAALKYTISDGIAIGAGYQNYSYESDLSALASGGDLEADILYSNFELEM